MNIEEFLETYPVHIADLAEQLRVFVRAQAPHSSETLHVGWRVISFGVSADEPHKFCAIAPHANWVNLQFHEGAALRDPMNLLEGTGQSMRHVKVQSAADLSEALSSLIHEALDNARA